MFCGLRSRPPVVSRPCRATLIPATAAHNLGTIRKFEQRSGGGSGCLGRTLGPTMFLSAMPERREPAFSAARLTDAEAEAAYLTFALACITVRDIAVGPS